MPQTRPCLPVTLAVKDTLIQKLANLSYQFLVRQSPWTSLGCDPRLLLPLSSGVIAGAGQLPDRNHASHFVRSFARRRKGTAHGFDFQEAKGRLPSSRAILRIQLARAVLSGLPR